MNLKKSLLKLAFFNIYLLSTVGAIAGNSASVESVKKVNEKINLIHGLSSNYTADCDSTKGEDAKCPLIVTRQTFFGDLSSPSSLIKSVNRTSASPVNFLDAVCQSEVKKQLGYTNGEETDWGVAGSIASQFIDIHPYLVGWAGVMVVNSVVKFADYASAPLITPDANMTSSIIDRFWSGAYITMGTSFSQSRFCSNFSDKAATEGMDIAIFPNGKPIIINAPCSVERPVLCMLKKMRAI